MIKLTKFIVFNLKHVEFELMKTVFINTNKTVMLPLVFYKSKCGTSSLYLRINVDWVCRN